MRGSRANDALFESAPLAAIDLFDESGGFERTDVIVGELP